MITDHFTGLSLEVLAGDDVIDAFLVVRKGDVELARVGLYTFSFPQLNENSVFFAIYQSMSNPSETVAVTIKNRQEIKFEFFYDGGEFVVTIGTYNLIFSRDQVLDFFQKAAKVAGCWW